MRISDHTAKMIVEKLKDVIDYDLNFFDQEGYIIYSTNSIMRENTSEQRRGLTFLLQLTEKLSP